MDDEETIDVDDFDSVVQEPQSVFDQIEDPQSRALIESILVAESDLPASEKTENSKQSHLKRWSEEEDKMFLQGLSIYGYGNWKKISDFMRSRNALQVKNRARHILTCMDEPSKKSLVEQVKEAFALKNKPSPKSHKVINESSGNESVEEIDILDESEETFSPPPVVKTEPVEEFEAVEEYYEEETQNELKIIEEEVVLNENTIGDNEMIATPEFFTNKGPKTPLRYLKIRNHIIEKWKQTKPNYLTKLQARDGLKDCGDVNAIGRIHSFLELNGVINSGHPISCKISKIVKKTRISSQEVSDAKARQRKVRDLDGSWVDAKELEGRTLLHRTSSEIIEEFLKSQRPKRLKSAKSSMDDFELVPLAKKSIPFSVEVDKGILAVIDTHSRLVDTEVIGLLGGKFGNGILSIQVAIPCHSCSSSGIQCELDPVSEIEAVDELTKLDMCLVGWYHSHPTFEPIPSKRDIENQSAYQSLFRAEDGSEPFIGIIASPRWKEETIFSFISIDNSTPNRCPIEVNVNYNYCMNEAIIKSYLQETVEKCKQDQRLLMDSSTLKLLNQSINRIVPYLQLADDFISLLCK